MAADANPFRYCGEYWDSETETYYLRAGYYDPVSRLTYLESRALEQALISAFTLEALNNMINSISPAKWSQFKREFERVNSLISGSFLH